MGGTDMKLILTLALSVLVLAACKNPHGPEAGPAQGYHIVSAQVGPLLKEAQDMTKAGDWKGAMGKVNEAEALKSSSDDATVINQMRHYIEVRSSQPSQP